MVYWLDTQDHTSPARGKAPLCERPEEYTVYRNAITDNFCVNDGTGDQTWSLQCAINEQYKSGDRGSRANGPVTCQPRVVFVPSGTYQIKSTVHLQLGTVLVGDPTNPPIIKAAPDFRGDSLINGDAKLGADSGTTNFMILMKNIVIDTTSIPNQQVTALNWNVAQGCGLTNVSVVMPSGQTHTGHTGIWMKYGSTITVTDVNITGGLVGINFASQQAAFKCIGFKFCTTALKVSGGFSALVQNASFEKVGVCTDITQAGGFGSFTLLDCVIRNSGPAVKLQAWQQVAIQNLDAAGTTNPIATDGGKGPFLGPTDHVDTWIKGNVQPGGSQRGMLCSTTPPAALLDSHGKFLTKAQPTYREVAPEEVVNVKSVPEHIVIGDGKQDETDSLNAILAANAASNKITYFPSGVYLIGATSPLKVPAGSRIVGEGWPTLSGHQNQSDPANPVPIVQIGQKDEVGMCEISEMRFDVSTILPGAKIIEVNMAGKSPGDVGIWNCLITVGGTRDCRFAGGEDQQDQVTRQDVTGSRAAFVTLHLTETSSAYIENLWSWTADHYIDNGSNLGGGGPQIISTGRGLLCEATKGTWLTGTGFEHHWLYQYNFHNASNVFAGMLQTETPYMEGAGAVKTVPAPWTPDPAFGDPDYSWADPKDQTSRVAFAVIVNGGGDLYFYNGAHWAFFTGPWFGNYSAGNRKQVVQTDMIRVSGSPTRFIYYGVNTKAAIRIINDGQGPDQGVLQRNFQGGWGEAHYMNGGQLMAYRTFA